MKKSHLRILELLFAWEIERALGHPATANLPKQMKSKHLPEMEKLGLVRQVTEIYGKRFPVTCTGWLLTEMGRMEYSIHCETLTTDL